jgi:hypothetical protein
MSRLQLLRDVGYRTSDAVEHHPPQLSFDMKSSHPSRWIEWLKRLAFLGVTLLTLVVLALTIEGYRGKRAWLACEQELKSQGEKLRWSDLVLPSVPNDQNFLATPALAACFGFEVSLPAASSDTAQTNTCDQLMKNLTWASHLSSAGDWREGTVLGLDQWQAKLRENPDDEIRDALHKQHGVGAPVVQPPQPSEHPANSCPAWAELRARPPGTPLEDLRFLLNYDRAVLDEIRVAARRPFARLDLTAGSQPEVLIEGMMPRFAKLKGLVYPFHASCWTELVAGNPRAALTDLETILAVGEAAGSQPLLIAALLKIAITEKAIQPLWSGLAEHRWPDAELAELETLLSRVNLVTDMQRCLRGERAFGLAMLLPSSSETDSGASAKPNSVREAMRFWPAAVIYRNRINLAHAHQALLITRLDPSGPSVRVTPTAEDQALRLEFSRFSPYNVFSPQLLPAIEKSLENAAKSQATITLARVACALERYRLAQGDYPGRLDELAPRFIAQIPPDPVNGGALHYRRDAPNEFLLYSIGLNGQDDGGAPMPRKSSGGRVAQQGDIVWRSLVNNRSAEEPKSAD